MSVATLPSIDVLANGSSHAGITTIPAATLPRSSGVLLHPTSLPGTFGIGDLGPVAFRWVETLAAMKQTWWQVLPLGPTGAGDSPYQSYSAFGGSINLLSPEFLERDGLISSSFWTGQHFSDQFVDYNRVSVFKKAMLREAWNNYKAGKGGHLRGDFERFQGGEQDWLADYALFFAIRESLNGAGLQTWPSELRKRNPKALASAEHELADAVGMHKFGQFLFDRQWMSLKAFAAERHIRIIGDLPIFVSLDSADVWAHADEFLLDREGNPTVVAGVPPDYFAEDGQHWGNPIYDWDRMAETDYSWWTARFRQTLKQVDLVRLDHFRGFRQAWHIPASEKTARNGKWVDGPGEKLFTEFNKQLGGLPIIAEDLGLITPDVDKLRNDFGLPGMKVIMFALDKPSNPYWPHNYTENSICYTGTHDNDTVNGWYGTLNERDRKYLFDYVGHHLDNPAWDLIRLAWASTSCLAVAPLQDILSLGSDARMNRPGIPTGNWRWRFRLDQFHGGIIERLAWFTSLYNRDTILRKAEGRE